MNKICTNYSFSKYMTEHMQLNSPVVHSVNSAEIVGPCNSNPDSIPTYSCGNQSDASIHNGDADNNISHFHYIPVLQALKSYLQQTDVWASIQNAHRPANDANLHDFTDGLFGINVIRLVILALYEFICMRMKLKFAIQSEVVRAYITFLLSTF